MGVKLALLALIVLIIQVYGSFGDDKYLQSLPKHRDKDSVFRRGIAIFSMSKGGHGGSGIAVAKKPGNFHFFPFKFSGHYFNPFQFRRFKQKRFHD